MGTQANEVWEPLAVQICGLLHPAVVLSAQGPEVLSKKVGVCTWSAGTLWLYPQGTEVTRDLCGKQLEVLDGLNLKSVGHSGQ